MTTLGGDMNTVLSKGLSAGVLVLLIFLTGFWLTHSGKPYNTMLVTVHKLIALGTVVFLGVTVHRVSQTAPLQPIQILAIAIAGLFFLATIVTGGLVTANQEFPAIVRSAHHIGPYLTLLASAAALYLLLAASHQIPAG